MRTALSMLLAASVTLAAQPARAVPLIDLLAGGTVTAGDKLFSQFDRLVGDPTLVEVLPLVGDFGEGLRFSRPGGALDPLLLFVSVEVLDPAFAITGLAAAQVGFSTTISAELLDPPTGDVLGSVAASPATPESVDELSRAVTTGLIVLTISSDSNLLARVTVLQSPVDGRVASPTALLLVIAGAVVLGARRRWS